MSKDREELRPPRIKPEEPTSQVLGFRGKWKYRLSLSDYLFLHL